MKQTEIKAILNMISRQETKKLLLLVIEEIERDIIEPEEMGTDIQRAEYVGVLVGRIKGKLKQQIQKDNVVVQTRDLESLIKAIKDGKE